LAERVGARQSGSRPGYLSMLVEDAAPAPRVGAPYRPAWGPQIGAGPQTRDLAGLDSDRGRRQSRRPSQRLPLGGDAPAADTPSSRPVPRETSADARRDMPMTGDVQPLGDAQSMRAPAPAPSNAVVPLSAPVPPGPRDDAQRGKGQQEIDITEAIRARAGDRAALVDPIAALFQGLPVEPVRTDERPPAETASPRPAPQSPAPATSLKPLLPERPAAESSRQAPPSVNAAPQEAPAPPAVRIGTVEVRVMPPVPAPATLPPSLPAAATGAAASRISRLSASFGLAQG